MVRLARRAGVSLVWLLTSEGEAIPEEKPARGEDQEQLIAECVEALERLLVENGLELSPEKKTRAVLLTFRLARQSGEVDVENLRRLIELAA